MAAQDRVPTLPCEDGGVGAHPEEAFEVNLPSASTSPVIHASPHSGRFYPPDLMRLAALDSESIRTSEDVLVDEIIRAAPAHGSAMIRATFARAYVDVNREPFELDPDMFMDELPPYARPRTARVAAGIGSIARVVGDGREIYRAKLLVGEALDRIERVHRPYHRALADLIAQAKERHGTAVLLDWHSMPAAAVGGYGVSPPVDVVLGDRFGASCGRFLIDTLESEFKARGYRVARNTPYAGGYTTEHYGRPHAGVHAVQVELSRGLYLDQTTLSRTSGFASLSRDVSAIMESLSRATWMRLGGRSHDITRRAAE